MQNVANREIHQASTVRASEARSGDILTPISSANVIRDVTDSPGLDSGT